MFQLEYYLVVFYILKTKYIIKTRISRININNKKTRLFKIFLNKQYNKKTKNLKLINIILIKKFHTNIISKTRFKQKNL